MTGVDASEQMLAIARQRATETHADVVFEAADAHKLPFAAGSFDVAMSLRVLMLLTWNADTKSAAFAAGGLHSVLDLLNHSNAGVRKMASWIAKLAS